MSQKVMVAAKDNSRLESVGAAVVTHRDAPPITGQVTSSFQARTQIDHPGGR
jgi:hypothetical protein